MTWLPVSSYNFTLQKRHPTKITLNVLAKAVISLYIWIHEFTNIKKMFEKAFKNTYCHAIRNTTVSWWILIHLLSANWHTTIHWSSYWHVYDYDFISIIFQATVHTHVVYGIIFRNKLWEHYSSNLLSITQLLDELIPDT